MGKTRQDFYDVDVYSNALAGQSNAATLFLVCSSLQVFSSCRSIFPGVILALLFASFLSTTSIASLTCSWRAQQVSRIDIGERGDWPVSVGEDRQNIVTVALETTEHLQPLLNRSTGSFTSVTGKMKMWRKLHEKGRSGCQLGKGLDEGGRKRFLRHRWAKKNETWCSSISDLLAQNKPVVSSWHHNKELKREPKTTRLPAATSEGET